MKSRKFPTVDEAIAYMEKAGTVKLYGREEDFFIYTVTVGSAIYQIMLHENGLLKVFNVRYE